MKRDHWPVGDHGIRPNGKPTECFYCGAERGAQHKEGCVIRSRTVVIRATVEYVIDIPEDWDKEALEFHRNEGSWCSDNAVGELEELVDRLDKSGGCTCPMTSFRYVREATPEDEEASHLYCGSLPS